MVRRLPDDAYAEVDEDAGFVADGPGVVARLDHDSIARADFGPRGSASSGASSDRFRISGMQGSFISLTTGKGGAIVVGAVSPVDGVDHSLGQQDRI